MGVLDVYKADKKMSVIPIAQKAFTEFFSDYYSQNSKVRNVDFRVMKNNIGYCAVIEYKDFTQIYNFYYSTGLIYNISLLVNSCFEIEKDGKRLLCHFVDILNAVDSDDISFYSYQNRATEGDIKAALTDITAATEKYYSDILSVITDDEKIKLIAEAYATANGYVDEVEYLVDVSYFNFINECGGYMDEYYKTLKINNKSGSLDDYEKRAYRVLSASDKKELKNQTKDFKKSNSNIFKFEAYIYIPWAAFAVIFGAVFAYIGICLDKALFSEWIGKNHLYSGITFFILGILVGIIIVNIVKKPLYKLIVPKYEYEEFSQVLAAENSSTYMNVLICVLIAIVFAIFFFIFGFSGIGVTKNYEIKVKNYTLSETETYSFEKTQIAIIKYADDGGEYTDTAYAFLLGEEWVDFGVPDEEAEKIIESGIKKYNKDVKNYDYFEELPYEYTGD